MNSRNENPSPRRSCLFHEQGLVPYETAWQWQRQWVAERVAEQSAKQLGEQPAKSSEKPSAEQFEERIREQAGKLSAQVQAPSASSSSEARSPSPLQDLFLLLEHPPVYTLGQGSSIDFLKFDLADAPYPIVRIERGGEVTHHCPGQLVGYPILNLRYYQQDLHWYLRQLEEVLIRVLANYQLEGERIPGLTGVWVEKRKVAAIGIKVSRWITMHGFALNVSPDLSGFQHIVPCGISDRPVGSLAQFVPDIQIDRVRQQVADAFAEVFHVELIPAELPRSAVI
ncbi:lipoyl(octanoyl) transferase LipB [Leptolyngbya ohadii]|uniref:lipoyl(octanoyl) transferase LipB n=1 Tax=Leptolyngbya ohadii TaxID=1962290 RepID=UPI001CECD6E0|nr:lipoyl(octanoyl) transferase LipB [Leptolyngbya ohadii]